MVGPHLEVLYVFWRDTNDKIGKESIYLNTATNNFLEGTNFNYSCISLNNLGTCRQDYIMPEVQIANSMLNIPSCFTLVTLEAKNAIPVTNYCKAIKVFKNIESNSKRLKLLSGSLCFSERRVL
jgi:hypothetical protein